MFVESPRATPVRCDAVSGPRPTKSNATIAASSKGPQWNRSTVSKPTKRPSAIRRKSPPKKSVKRRGGAVKTSGDSDWSIPGEFTTGRLCTAVKPLRRQHGCSEASDHRWGRQSGGLRVPDAKPATEQRVETGCDGARARATAGVGALRRVRSGAGVLMTGTWEGLVEAAGGRGTAPRDDGAGRNGRPAVR